MINNKFYMIIIIVASILKLIFLPWKNQKGFILLVDPPF